MRKDSGLLAVVFLLVGCFVEEGPSDITTQRIRALKSGDIETRRRAAMELALRVEPQDPPYSVPALIEVLGEKDPILIMNAYRSLQHLTQEELPLDKDSWQRRWAHVQRIRDKTKAGEEAGYAIQTERAKVFNTRGLVKMQEGFFASAARQFQQAIDLDPQAAYHSNLARCYINVRDYRRALLACEDALGRDPALQKAYFHMGDAWAQMPGLDHAYEAYSAYKKAIKFDVRGINWAAHWGLSRILLRRARATTSSALYEEAAEEIDKALGIAERTGELRRMPQLFRDAALIYYGLGRYYRAYRATEEVEKAGYAWRDEDFLRKLDEKLAELGHITRREKQRRREAARGKELPPAMRYAPVLREP